MTLTELKYIVTVAREKNFNRAAEKCFVSQPTLSIAIKKLEEQLDIVIFERRKSHISVTETGQKIIQQAQLVLEEAEKIKHIAKANQDQLNEKLSIGAIHTVGPYLFPQLIASIKKLMPKMPLIIEENYTAELITKLQQGELDVAIIALPLNKTGITTIPLYCEPFEIIIPENHPWQDKKSISPDDFRDETVLLLGEGNCFRDQVLTACPACALPPEAETNIEKMVEGSSLETIRYMVASGLGISVMPKLTNYRYQNAGENLLVKAFSEQAPEREIALAFRSSFPRENALVLVKQAVQDCQLPGIDLL